MTDPSSPADPGDATDIDTSVASEARVYDHLLGGVSHFAIDREGAERQGASQGGIQYAQAGVRANRNFLGQPDAILDQVTRFFDGLELVRGDVTLLEEWLGPDQEPELPEVARMHWCGIGRKP